MSESSSDFDLKPKKRAQKKLQLEEGVVFQALTESCFIPGTTFLIQSKMQCTESDEHVYLENMVFENGQKLSTKDVLYLIENLNRYLGNGDAGEEELRFHYLEYIPVALQDKNEHDTIEELIAKKKISTAIEYLLLCYKKYNYAKNTTISNEIIQMLQTIEQKELPDDPEERLKIINALLTLLRVHSEAGQISQVKILEMTHELCRRCSCEENTELRDYIKSTVVICQIHLHEHTKTDSGAIEEQINELKQILLRCLAYLEEIVGLHSRNAAKLFEVNSNKLIMTLPYYVEINQSNFLIQKDFLISQSFNQFNLIIATVIQILVSFYHINNNQSPLTGKATTSKTQFHREQASNPFNKQQFELIPELLEREKNQDTVIDLIENNSGRMSAADSDSTESSMRSESFMRPNTARTEFSLDTYIPIETTHSILEQEYGEMLDLLIRNNDNILQILLELRQYTSVENLEKFLLDTFMVNQHQSVTRLLMKWETDNTLENTTVSIQQDSQILECYVYSQYENTIHTLFTMLRQSKEKYLTEFKYNTFFMDALNNQCYLLPSNNFIERGSIALLEYSFEWNANEPEEATYCNYIEQAEMYENIGDWCSAVNNLIEALKYAKENEGNVAIKIGQLLSDHAEYKLAELFFCSAIGATSQNKVFYDERESRKNNMNVQSMGIPLYYNAIKNMSLIEMISHRRSSSTDNVSDSSGSVPYTSGSFVNSETLDIYMKRVDCYLRIQEFSAAIKIIDEILSNTRLVDEEELYLRHKECQIYLQFIPNTVLDRKPLYKKYYNMLKSFSKAEDVRNKIIVRALNLFSLYFLKLGSYNHSLYLTMLAQKVEEGIHTECTLPYEDVKTYSSEIGLVHWLEGVLGISCSCINEHEVPLTQERHECDRMEGFSFEFVLNEITNHDSEVSTVLVRKQGRDVSGQAMTVSMCREIYFQLLIYMINTVDQNVYYDSRQNLISDLMYFINFIVSSPEELYSIFQFYQQHPIQFGKVHTSVANGAVDFGFNYMCDGQCLYENIVEFKNFLVKETFNVLQFTTNIELKTSTLLSYCEFCINEQKRAEEASKILENVVETVYCCYMCGQYTIQSFFDFSIQELSKVRQIYQEIIMICLQFSPKPPFTQLFVDAVLNIESVIENISQRKIHPCELFGIQDADETIDDAIDEFPDDRYRSMPPNMIKIMHQYTNNMDRVPKVKNMELKNLLAKTFSYNQATEEDYSIENIKEQVIEFTQKLPTVLEVSKLRDVGTNQLAMEIYDALLNEKYNNLSLFESLYNQNMQDFMKESSPLVTLNEVESTIEYDQFILHEILLNNEYDNEHSITKSRLQETDELNEQQRVQEIINAADVVRQCVAEMYNINYNLKLYEFVARYYSKEGLDIDCESYIKIQNKIYCLNDQLDVKQIVKIDSADEKNEHAPINISNASYCHQNYQITLFGNQHSYHYHHITCIKFNEILGGYICDLFRQKPLDTASQCNFIISKQMVNQLENIFEVEEMCDETYQRLHDENKVFDMNSLMDGWERADCRHGVKHSLENSSFSSSTNKIVSVGPSGAELTRFFHLLVKNMEHLRSNNYNIMGRNQFIGRRQIVVSPELSYLPFEQLYNQHVDRYFTHFELVQSRGTRRRQERFQARVLGRITDLQQQLLERNVALSQLGSEGKAPPREHHAADQGAKGLKELSSACKADLQHLTLYALQVDVKYLIEQLHFCHSIEARGQSVSLSKEHRYHSIRNVALDTFHIGAVPVAPQDATDDMDTQHNSKTYANIYSNIQGVLMPFHTELLKIGQKTASSSLKRQIGHFVRIIDISDYIMTNQFIFLKKDLREYKDIAWLLDNYESFINEQQNAMDQPAAMKKVRSVVKLQTCNWDIMGYKELFSFIQQQCRDDEADTPATVLPKYKQIAGKHLPDAVLKQLLIITFQDLEALTDLVFLSQNKVSIMVVPSGFVTQITIFISEVNSYLEQRMSTCPAPDSYDIIQSDSELFCAVLAYVIRRVLGIPVCVYR